MMSSPTERRNPNCDAVKQLLPFCCISNFWDFLISFARRHFKRSDTMTMASPMASPLERTNPKIIDSLPTLPFDIITEILSRLPVKLLLQFRCVCKSWNSLISDHKFARKHFNKSATPTLYVLCHGYPPSQRFALRSYPLQSVFTDLTTDFVQLDFPFNSRYEHNLHYFVGSCDGILCLADFENTSVILWNPSIRKFKELPPFEKPEVAFRTKFGFGYDHVSHDYKVVVLYHISRRGISETTEIKVYSSRANSWRSFQTLPFCTEFRPDQSGIYVNGTINWLASTKFKEPFYIVSFDLGKDSYRKIFPPKRGVIGGRVKLCVLRNCLCIISYYDVWVMKEYGIKESWTKLFKVSNSPEQGFSSFLTNVLYIFEDDQVLLVERRKKELIVYDLKNDTFKITVKFPTIPEICTESLISPCF